MIRFRFGAGLEELERDAGRHQLVIAGEALLRGGADRLGQREQRVDPGEQLLALGARRWVAEPVGRAERRDRERGRLAEREVGDRRQARLEAVDEVELPVREREP